MLRTCAQCVEPAECEFAPLAYAPPESKRYWLCAGCRWPGPQYRRVEDSERGFAEAGTPKPGQTPRMAGTQSPLLRIVS